MAFAYTVEHTINVGDQKGVIGTYTNSSGGTGGAIVTGLNAVKFFIPVTTGSAVSAAQATINGTHIFGGSVTIKTTADTAGIWLALGF